MSGACNGGGDMYQSFPGQAAGWYPTCGTSEATPEFAGIVALADQVAGHPIGLINPCLYATVAVPCARPGRHHVRQQHGVSFQQGGKRHTVTGFAARPGYDLASGVGTVERGAVRAGAGPVWRGTCPARVLPSSRRWARRRA